MLINIIVIHDHERGFQLALYVRLDSRPE